MFTNQMKADIVELKGDLGVVNAARASFGFWKEQMDEKDERLIGFLAKNMHKSPFYHDIYAFVMPENGLDHIKLLSDNALNLGFVYDGEIASHSLFGWLHLIKEGVVRKGARNILKELETHSPVSFRELTDMMKINVEEYEYERQGDAPSPYQPDLSDEKFRHISFLLEMPVFVARHFYTHRLFAKNEISRRYVRDKVELYFPECFRMKPEGSKKQGSSDKCKKFLSKGKMTLDVLTNYREACEHSMKVYQDMNDFDIAPEMARMILPQSMMTKFIMTGTIENWERLIKLRTMPDAQKETRQMAEMIKEKLLSLKEQ